MKAPMKIGRILCPVDFSSFSRCALDYAVALAWWYGSRLTVLHVDHAPFPAITQLAPLAPVEAVVMMPSDLEQIRRRIAAFTPAEAQARVPVEAKAAEGDPAREILAEAASADLIVMGTHGRSGFDRLVLGSVTEKGTAQGDVLGADDSAVGAPCRRSACAVSANHRRGRFLQCLDVRPPPCRVPCSGGRCASDRDARDRGAGTAGTVDRS